MIEHADTALETWLATLDPPVDTTFERLDPSAARQRPVVSLLLFGVSERTDQRDTEVRDIRDGEGRVVERRRSTRFFEIDYLCTVGGPHREAHRALGAIIQLLVDHEHVPSALVPDELAALGHPVEVRLCPTAGPASAIASGGAIVLRLVLPVRPTPERQVAPPAVELHLDMTTPDTTTSETTTSDTTTSDTTTSDTTAPDTTPPLERAWTAVRRRELIQVRQPGEDSR